MKLLTFLTLLFVLLVPFQAAEAKKPGVEVIRLTARQVAGANDIESAILRATSWGRHPGSVILDGSQGPFVFTAPDKSLNIFVSGISLRGEHNAILSNCEDGLFFEGAPIKDVLVEKITFNCSGDGVEASGEFQNVTLRNNTIKASQFGIVLRGSSQGWEISDNAIEAGWDAIRLSNAREFNISNNALHGSNGVTILTGTGFMVKGNTISAHDQGVLLGQGASQNTVQANKISGVTLAGVALEPNSTNNKVQANKVTCAPSADCKAVDGPLFLGDSDQGRDEEN
jgi:hypothetical protein